MKLEDKKKKMAVKMDRKELIGEHKRLVGVLKSNNRSKEKQELIKQQKELQSYEKGTNC